jgi:hypothetical protein
MSLGTNLFIFKHKPKTIKTLFHEFQQRLNIKRKTLAQKEMWKILGPSDNVNLASRALKVTIFNLKFRLFANEN